MTAATCPCCERPWSEHTKGLPGFVPICPLRSASAASGYANTLDAHKQLAEANEKLRAERSAATRRERRWKR